MDLPTYTNIWRIEKRLYKLYDFRLPMPVPVGQIAVFTAIAVPYVVILKVAGLPFSHTLLWLYILPPGALAWLVTRPVLEGKRLPELVISQVRYLCEPRTWCRMAPLAEKDHIVVVARVWRRTAPLPSPQRAQVSQPSRAVATQAPAELAVAGPATPKVPVPVRVAPARAPRTQPAPGSRPASARRPVSPVRPVQAVRPAPATPSVSAAPAGTGSVPARAAATLSAAPSVRARKTAPRAAAATSPADAVVPASPAAAVSPASSAPSAPAPPGAAPVTTTVPAVAAPATEVPATAKPATEVPAAEVPAAEVAPAAAAPATAAAATTAPAPEITAADVPADEVPAGEAPAAEVPAAEVPAAAVPATAAPVTTGTATEAPAQPASPSRPAPPRRTRPAVTVAASQNAERPLPVVERALSRPAERRVTPWRDPVVVVPGGHRPGRPDQLQRDRSRARLALASNHRIVVLGCTVGAGQTVTALMAGELLASLRSEQVAALDLNPSEGSLAQRARSVPALTGSAPPGPSRLEVISREEAVASAGHDNAARIFELTSARYPLTLADPGAAVVPQLLRVASQLVLVAPANQDAAKALAATREWLEAHGHSALAKGAITVVNGVSSHTMAHVEQAEALARGQCRAIVRIPWDDRLSRHGPAPGDSGPARSGNGPLSPATLRAYTALAGVLVASVATAPAPETRQRTRQ